MLKVKNFQGESNSCQNQLLWTYVNRKYDKEEDQKEFENQEVQIPKQNLKLNLWNAPGNKKRKIFY